MRFIVELYTLRDNLYIRFLILVIFCLYLFVVGLVPLVCLSVLVSNLSYRGVTVEDASYNFFLYLFWAILLVYIVAVVFILGS